MGNHFAADASGTGTLQRPLNLRPAHQRYDILVIGGGFYGCAIASWLSHRFKRVMVAEKLPHLFGMASYVNQARVHQGYHYCRSLPTAASSHRNFSQFVSKFSECIDKSFVKLYCIAATRSKINARQFERFCRIVELPCRPAAPKHKKLFEPRLVEEVYETTEYAFDADILCATMRRNLASDGVELLLSCPVTSVTPHSDGHSEVTLGDNQAVIDADRIFVCTYSALRHIPGLRNACNSGFKHEIAELALVEPPPEFASLGITLMDGPFFSTMPFPARGLHSFSHVRYTPHAAWYDHDEERLPSDLIAAHDFRSRFPFMQRDAARYLPSASRAVYRDSIYTTKTVLVRSEVADGRPIVFERGSIASQVYFVLGGKIDNIYDVYRRLEQEFTL